VEKIFLGGKRFSFRDDLRNMNGKRHVTGVLGEEAEIIEGEVNNIHVDNKDAGEIPGELEMI
jgi:hypothetical protein